MGDMGDLYRDYDQIKQMRRVDRSAEADVRKSVIATIVNNGLIVDPNGTWNIKLNNANLQYYPTKGTWQFKGKMFKGGIHSFERWLRKQVV
jgi:phage pi2 protein 07